MGFVGGIWRVLRGRELVGEIIVEDADFPWLRGRFAPGPAFAGVKPLFDRDLELMEEQRWDEWEEVYEEIRKAVRMVAPSGPVAEFLLHIEKGEAWFRWSEEPFDESRVR
ncbi:hypothetical protein [Planomonospora parontospora]|uniref:hypothetical protein n=1 Tax=Planomonospora parontospora TaxID=58119 RepID=UPI001670066B|nr:hypothetical protein [Planomonospora parontospora]GGL33580.1 hypothetical protein GCM10014719_38460 [Planomonospora parontospora subsp. antibiotica]GII17161.1 hypothetical protein Ppa05_38870 [Planomonospora parontospora subsp. antibiotica]